MAISISDLNNAEVDVDHIAALATSPALTATDRFGNTKKTWSGIEQELGAEYAVTTTGENRIATEAARTEAELARDSALAAGRLYPSSAAAQADAGLAVGASYVAPLVDGSLQAYRKDSSVASTAIGAPFASAARLESLEDAVQPETPVVDETKWAVTDPKGYAPLSINGSGDVIAPSLVSQSIDVGAGVKVTHADSLDFVWGVADLNGNIALGVRKDGSVFPTATAPAPVDASWSELALGTDDAIIHIGDSYTASHFALKDKAYISDLSALSPYRHINYGVSGNNALDMQYRMVNGIATFGSTFAGANARYAFITTRTNDYQYRDADLTYYAENVRRLVELARAAGPEPVITTEFPLSTELPAAVAATHAQLRRVADEMGCGFVDCTSLDTEVGGLQLGPFFQGHPGTRTNGVFWLPMLDYIDRMPKPTRAIKIFRRRSTFAVSAIADLLYKGRADRAARWKELTVGHYSLTPESKFEELSQLGTVAVDYNYAFQVDEYAQLKAGGAVVFTDYALIEVTLPGTAATLEAVEVTLAVSAAATVYARDYLDVPASLPGQAQGATPTDPVYLSKWNKPRGAWRPLGAYAAPITIPAADLVHSMQGNVLVLMVSGAFSLSAFKVRYKGREQRNDLRQTVRAPTIGAELLVQPLCGTSGQLAGWTVLGSTAPLVPIDQYNAPRKPGVNTPVDGVTVVRVGDTIGQTVALPAETGALRRFRVTVWARHFPKAFLDPSKYPALDASQIVDRITNPTAAPITSETNDLRTLKCEVWAGASYPAEGGAEYLDFAALQWRPIEFVIEVVPFQASTLSFRLSCPDGDIQVAKASFKEISV